jgi:hypothetical protein
MVEEFLRALKERKKQGEKQKTVAGLQSKLGNPNAELNDKENRLLGRMMQVDTVE